MTCSITRSGMPVIGLAQMLCDLSVIIGSTYIIDLCVKPYGYSFNINVLLSILVLFFILTNIRDYYYDNINSRFNTRIVALLKVWIITTIGGFPILYAIYNQPIALIIGWFLIIGFMLCLSNFLFDQLGRYFPYQTLNIAFVGRQQGSDLVLNTFKKIPWTMYRIKGFYDNTPLSELHSIHKAGDLEQLLQEAKSGNIDQIYIIESIQNNHDVMALIEKLGDTTCTVKIIPNIFIFRLLRSRIHTVNHLPVISIYDTPFEGLSSCIKRIEDIVLSTLILLLISPLLLVIALLVKLTSKGPVLFKQDRYGENGAIISVWKFRTMKVMENGTQVKQAVKNDPRLTPIGGFLRKGSLDELPQFFNVLLGDMSVVGPRPHAIVHNEKYRKLIDGYMQRHKTKPGITGWAQINGYRGETDTLYKMEKRVEYDLSYIHNWSILLDVKIILLTIFKGFTGKSAY